MPKFKKEEIVKAAVKRFVKHGLHKTTLQEIARDLRIGKSSIYHYFASKEELFLGAIEDQIEVYLEDIRNIFNNEDISLQERFQHYFSFKLELKIRYRLLYNLLVSDLSKTSTQQEADLIKKMLLEEEVIIKMVLNVLHRDSTEVIESRTSLVLTMQTYMLPFIYQLFVKKLDDTGLNLNDKIVRNIESLLFPDEQTNSSAEQEEY